MKDLLEMELKGEYKNWIEAQTYLELKGIPKNKPDQLLNKLEKYEEIPFEDWEKSGLEYKKLKGKF